MAPSTRRSVAAGTAKKAPTRKQSANKAGPVKASKKQHDDTAMDIDQGDAEMSDDNIDVRPSQSIEATQTSLRVAFNPLRDMADKIGREVERFAVALDVYLQDITERQDRYQAAQDLVQDFKDIAQEAVDGLRARHEKQRDRQLREEWAKQARLSTVTDLSVQRESIFDKTRSLLDTDRGSAEEMRAWQEEVDLWELFRIVLETHYRPKYDPEGIKREQEQILSSLGKPNIYTSESELWQRFLAKDNNAKHKAMMKRWLEEAVDHQQSKISGIVGELETRAGAGRALWSNGWTHTREKIKGEKRLRSWPSASDSIQPQIRRSDNNELLVTQLDPDAPTKHGRVLEKPDAFFERATWMTCWEMLRRGCSWREVREWCEERNEGWRAMAMGLAGPNDNDNTQSLVWRKMCQAGSHAGGFNQYEAAVYGLLAGLVDPVIAVARSVDDHLYARYNATLLQQFDDYRRKHLETIGSQGPQSQGNSNQDSQDPSQTQQVIIDLIMRLRGRQETRAEATSPAKVLQSYLMANELEAMVNTVGTAIGNADKENGGSERLILRPESHIDTSDLDAETEVALDARSMRLVAHMAIILASLRSDDLHEHDLGIEENVVVSYIQQLRVAKKRDLIPVYASRLSEGRTIITMSDVLRDVSEPREQEELMKLMSEHYNFGVDRIFWEQTLDLTEQVLEKEEPQTRPITILENTEQKEYPGQRIMIDFLPEVLTESDVVIVNSLQWFLLLPGFWKLTFDALSLTVRKCLVVGRFACALEIVRNFPYELVSMQKSYQEFGTSINLMDDGLAFPADEDEALRWMTMRQYSRAYYELEQLIRIVESLSLWAQEERPYVSLRPTPSPIPSSIKQAKQNLVETIQPLINGILTWSEHEAEAADFDHIRKAYVPEIIIAYNTALFTAGNILTRDALLESMDLSVAIAREENGLVKCIVEAGRMRELVSSFARSSKAMLLLKAQSTKQWKPRKDREGKDPSIWEIGPQDSAAMSTSLTRPIAQS